MIAHLPGRYLSGFSLLLKFFFLPVVNSLLQFLIDPVMNFMSLSDILDILDHLLSKIMRLYERYFCREYTPWLHSSAFFLMMSWFCCNYCQFFSYFIYLYLLCNPTSFRKSVPLRKTFLHSCACRFSRWRLITCSSSNRSNGSLLDTHTEWSSNDRNYSANQFLISNINFTIVLCDVRSLSFLFINFSNIFLVFLGIFYFCIYYLRLNIFWI